MEHKDIAALEQDARQLRAELTGAFEAADAAAGRLESRGVSVTRVMAAWNREAAVLRTRFQVLGTTIGQGFASALTPAVAAMNRFMTTALRAARTFRSFLYSLLGKKVSAAVADTSDAWDDLGDSADTAGKKVAAAAKEVRRSLMAFDEIHRLDWEPESAGGASAAGGGDGSVLTLPEGWDDILEENPFGELLRSLAEDGQFYAVGQALAGKLGEIVDGLDQGLTDPSFRKNLTDKLGKLTDLINGFFAGMTFSEEGKASVAQRIGGFLGDAAGTALESLHAFLSGLDWENVGVTVAQLVNGAIASLREKDANVGTVLADYLNAKLGTLDGFFTEMDWAGAGAYVAENINAWFENMDWELVGSTVRDGILGLKDFVTTALGEIDVDWQSVLASLAEGLLSDKTKQWLRDHPALTNLIFGEDNPFTVVIGDVEDKVPGNKKSLTGFLAGLTSWRDALSDKTVTFQAKLTSFKDALSDKIVAFKAKLTSFKDALSDKIVAFKAKLTSFKDALSDKIVAFKAKLTSFKDALSDKIVAFKAKLTSWKDALSDKILSFKAKMSTWSDALSDKVVAFKAKLTTWTQDWLTSFKDKTITFKAKLTSWSDGIKSDSKWISGFGATISKWWNALTNTLVSFKAEGGVYAGGSWRPIQTYASGGAPGSGQLFVAREAGPELVGTLGGHTAVMNNDQIVASVSAGVAKAVGGIRFYSRERMTPPLAVLGASASRSEEHLAQLAKRAAEDAGAGGTARVAELLLRILTAVEGIDPDVYLDGESVKDRVVALINRNTQANGGLCEIVM